MHYGTIFRAIGLLFLAYLVMNMIPDAAWMYDNTPICETGAPMISQVSGNLVCG
jgi:hypothetical protein